MASFTLKNVPDDLLRALRRAADRDRRSLTQEIIHLLDSALHGRSPPSAEARGMDVGAQVEAWRALAGRWESDTDARREGEELMERRTPGRDIDL